MKRNKSGIWWKVLVTLAIVFAIFFSGYFVLDRVIVPKYFSEYGINNVPDLMGVVTSLYKSPKESKLVTNGYTKTDLSNSITKLQNANYKIENDGTVNKENFKGDKRLELSDKEFAAVCNKMLEDGLLVDALPNLNYLNTMKIHLLQVVVKPDKNAVDGEGYSAGNISFIIKINTVDIREHIAEQMQTPLYLLNMIIPNNLYFSVSYDFDLNAVENKTNGTIAINGRTAKQSELLINLLIGFIFPPEDNMNLENFKKTIGDIAIRGINELGEFKFYSKVDGKLNGFLINGDKVETQSK